MTASLCFIDTETDGVHPDRKAWDIAIIRRDPNGQETERHFFVGIDLSTADPFGLKVGRFYERHPAGRFLSGRVGSIHAELDRGVELLSTYDAAEEVAKLTHGAHLVGAVPSFDAEVFDRLLRDHELIPAWHYHLIDVEALAVGYVFGQNTPRVLPDSELDLPGLPWDSDRLSRLCGVSPPGDEQRHTALGDAEWAMHLYDAITGGGA